MPDDGTLSRRDQIAEAMLAQADPWADGGSSLGSDPYVTYASVDPSQSGASPFQIIQGLQTGYIDPYYEGTTNSTSTNPDDFVVPNPPWNLQDITPDPTPFQGVDPANNLGGYFEGSSPYDNAGASGIPGSYGAPGAFGRHRRGGL
jgi:hypothetical protein